MIAEKGIGDIALNGVVKFVPLYNRDIVKLELLHNSESMGFSFSSTGFKFKCNVRGRFKN